MPSLEFLAITNDVELYEDWRPGDDLSASQADEEKHKPAAQSLFKACQSLRDVFLEPPGSYFLPVLEGDGELIHVRKMPGSSVDEEYWERGREFEPIWRFSDDGWPAELQVSSH